MTSQRRSDTRRRSRRRWALGLLTTVVVLAPLTILLILLVTQHQREDFESRSLTETRSILAAVPEDIEGRAADRLGRALRRPAELEVVLVDGRGVVSSSSPVVGLADVPLDLRSGGPAAGAVRTSIAGEPFLVTGGSGAAGSTDVFLFFSERPLEQDRNRSVLLITLLSAAVLLTTATGGWVQTHRRTRALAARREEERAYTAHLAHELRTPVGALVTAASLVDEPTLRRAPVEVRRPVEVMQEQSRRLRRIVEDQLELSRLAAGQVEIRTEPVDVAQVVRETVATHGGADVELDLAEGAIAAVDRQSLARLLLNLITNAVQHARARVRVVVQSSATLVTVEVVDDGPGMDPDLAALLVDPADSHDREAEVAREAPGLGLLIARAHATLLHASITVDGDGPAGTTVRVELGAADETTPATGPNR